MEELLKRDSVIEENQGKQEEQFWWMNIEPETWNIAEGDIGEPKTLSSPNIQSLSKDYGFEEVELNWLFRYFKDTPDNPHFGIPIAPQEMAISLLDIKGESVNNSNIEKKKKRVTKILDTFLCPMGIVKNPNVVLDKKSYKRNGARRAQAWMTLLDENGKPLEKIIKDKWRRDVSTGERVTRELSSHTFVHYFYRPNDIPQYPYTPGHEYEEGYVQAAPKVDPEINYDINGSPYPNFHTGDIVIAYNVSNKRITGLLKVLSVNGEKVTLQIEEVYYNPVFVVDIVGVKYLSQILIPFKLSLEEFREIKKEVILKNPRYANNNSRKYSKDDLLNSAFIDGQQLADIDNTLEDKKCIILQGAPGVGKTFLAEQIAFARMKEKNVHRIELVQFHPNYTYEDFIIGYKPREGKDKKKNDGGFALKDGVFKAFCHNASLDTDNDYYFIIDEINRGNISKIFGEAFSLIEKSYRGKSIKLAYSQKKFVIPENVYIIGLMNTADRSLAMIDFALRRRFAIFTLEPAFETDTFKNYQKNINSPVLDKIIQGIVDLNNEIIKDRSLGPGFCIGHSYFCFKNKEEVNDDRLRRIVEYEIIPMLQEYWFDNEGKYKEEAKKLKALLDSDDKG